MPEWQKVLYQKQDYPDDYVPDTFLNDLKKNVNLKYFTISEAIIGAGFLSQEVSCIVIFIASFIQLNSGHSSNAITTCTFIGLSTVLLYFILTFLTPSKHVKDDLKSLMIFMISGFATSPILKTLTETISTDTVYTMAAIMMLVHLIFYDYGATAAIVSTPLSLNAAIFGAVCLASRLSTTYHVFALMVFASDIFVLFTVLRKRLRDLFNTRLQIFITLSLAVSSVICLSLSSHQIFLNLYFVLLICINFLFPFGFYKVQYYKENIYGPWDEAVIDTPVSEENISEKKKIK